MQRFSFALSTLMLLLYSSFLLGMQSKERADTYTKKAKISAWSAGMQQHKDYYSLMEQESEPAHAPWPNLRKEYKTFLYKNKKMGNELVVITVCFAHNKVKTKINAEKKTR